MEVLELVKKYLKEGLVMQLATVREGQPWVCSVYYASDDKLNIYWLSWPERRHSQELAANVKAAITIAIKTDFPVIGLGAEGVVKVIKDPEIVKDIMQLYVKRHKTGKDFYDNFIASKNKHLMYRFKPTKFSLFDELNFPKSSSQDWRPDKKEF